MTTSGISRRTFLKLGATAVGGVVVGSATYLYLSDESQHPVVHRVSIPLKGLNPSLEGFTIAQLSDIHLRPYTRPDLVQRVVDMTNALTPDVTVATGDFVWTKAESIFELAPILAQLNARYGVYTVLGNHDYWEGVEVIKMGLNEARLSPLLNQGVPITVGDGIVWLAGLDDGWSGQPDLDAALNGAPGDSPVILLLHEPDLADWTSLDGRVSLQLSGHSHGGQVRLPGVGALVLPEYGRKYDLGLYNVNGMWLYTNGGIGCISIPVRYNCPPEISLFTLVQA